VPPAVAAAVARFAAGNDVVATANEGGAAAWCSPAALSQYEVLVAGADAGPRFDAADDDTIASVARATRRVMTAVAGALGDVPYNVVVHTAAATGKHGFHWYVRVTPRLTVRAGFEDGTGLFVNTVPPEVAAAELRRARS
jgi:UDPglucose--hexose-1-phosphate uridylyltransferase